MASVLVVFESKYGQTEKIAAHIADAAQRRGHATKLLRASEARFVDMHGEDAVFVVAPVYFARYPRAIEAFVRAQADLLSSKPSGFVSVGNGAASSSAEERRRALRVARKVLAETGFKARSVTAVGGALAYPRYGMVLRLVMKAIAKREGEPTDVKRVHELTDWAVVDYATNGVLDALEMIGTVAAE